VGFFNWAAPMFHRADRRWTDDDIAIIGGWLRPALPVGGALLDVGGGTGALAARLAETLDAHATVLDPTPEMLRYAPSGGRLSVVLGEAQDMPFADDAFDALLVSDAFHHFRDQRGAAAEFGRVVRPGGIVVVLELDPSGVAMWLLRLGERALGEPGAFHTPEALCALMRDNRIDGAAERQSGASYRFVGTVREPR